MTNRLKICRVIKDQWGYTVELDTGHEHYFFRATIEYLKQIRDTIDRHLKE